MNKNNALKRLLNPKTVALFGGRAVVEVIRQCRKVGFTGDLWPVNPRRDDMEGIRCFRSASELPSAPDAAFIGVGPEASIGILEELSAIGAGGAVCYAAGFAETGASDLQARLLAAAGDMAVVGPNCHGLINYLDGVALWPDEHGGTRAETGAAIILQSGNIAISISMQDRSLPISYLITVGNKADLGMHDYINAVLDDPRVTAIGLHIEGLDDIPAFSEASIRALRKKIPIVCMKTGTSALGAEATLSHTSSLAGSDELYSALFKRLGIARCETISTFIETLKFLAIRGSLPGNTVASMSCSGGEASMIADQAELLGLEMPPFTAQSSESLHRTLGDKVHIANPLDYHTYIWGDQEAMTACYSAVLSSGCDCNILAIDYPRPELNSSAAWEVAEQALIKACDRSGRPAVLMSTMSENLPAVARTRLLEAGILPMQGLKECMLAIKAAADIGNAQARAASILPVAGIGVTSGTATMLNEFDSKLRLAECGLSVPVGELVTPDIAAERAAAIGFPVCVKIVSTTQAHKSDVGGVALNLKDALAVRAAVDRMRTLSESFLVEKMVDSALVELIVGIKREPGFGLALVIGAGGILVELMKDSASLLLPVSRDEIEHAIRKLRVFKLMNGFRGAAVADLGSTVDAVCAVADFAMQNRDSLLELDVNPLLITANGAFAADAVIRLADNQVPT